MASNPGMYCNTTLYEASRFAPIVLNLPQLSRALGSDLRGVLEEYWSAHPHGSVNLLLECERFCHFLSSKMAEGWQPRPAAKEALDREYRDLSLRLAARSTVL